MRVINCLHNYAYPVYRDLKTVNQNTQLIVDVLLALYPNLQEVNTINNSFLTIVCRGTSGLTIALAVQQALPVKEYVEICYLRKKGEQSHSAGDCPSYFTNAIVIVDDFVSSGETIQAIADELTEADRRKVYVISCMRIQRVAKLRELFPNVQLLIY